MLKRFNAQKYYWSKEIIKNYNVIINGKKFYDQPIDSDIKRYEKIRITTGCLLDYDYIKNHYQCWSKSTSTNGIRWTIKKTRWQL